MKQPKTCATCLHYRLWRIMCLAHICLKEQPINSPHQPACKHYSTKNNPKP